MAKPNNFLSTTFLEGLTKMFINIMSLKKQNNNVPGLHNISKLTIEAHILGIHIKQSLLCELLLLVKKVRNECEELAAATNAKVTATS